MREGIKNGSHCGPREGAFEDHEILRDSVHQAAGELDNKKIFL
jgi:hypothetical protein